MTEPARRLILTITLLCIERAMQLLTDAAQELSTPKASPAGAQLEVRAAIAYTERVNALLDVLSDYTIRDSLTTSQTHTTSNE
jgi:hypothetical protein